MEKTKKKSFLQDLMTLGFGTVLYMLVGIIGTPIVTRLVDPVDYGRMSILTVYSSIGMMLCGLGLDQTMLRYFYREDLNYQRKLVLRCCGIPVGVAIGVGTLALAAHLLGLRLLPLSELILLWVNVFALLVNRYALLLLRLRYHTKAYSTVNIIQKTAYILFTVGLVLFTNTHHFMALALATVGSTLLAALVAMALERDIWRLPDGVAQTHAATGELLKYGFPIMLASSINVVFAALDKLFIKHYCTMADVGVYASAMNLMAIFTVVRTTFNGIWMPAAVGHYEKNPEDKRFYQQGNALISVVMLTFGAGVVLFKDLFVLLLGKEYQAASMILPYLMFEPIMYTISETTATGMVVQKKPVYQVIVAGGSCVANFIGNWILTPLMGPQGAALSTGVAYIVFFTLRTVLSNRVFYVRYRLSGFAVAVAALMAFAVYGSNHSFTWIQIPMCAGVVAVVAAVYWKDILFGLRTYLKRKKK